MLRDPSLVPLSQQHHDALALCVYIERASKSCTLDLAHWNGEVSAAWENEIRIHFQAEEEVVFPAAEVQELLRPLIGELLSEHAQLRQWFSAATLGRLTAAELLRFRQTLHDHIRKEERQLFAVMPSLLQAAELARIGVAIEALFQRETDGAVCSARPPRPQPV